MNPIISLALTHDWELSGDGSGDIEQVQLVFKDGTGYDPEKLLAAAKGHFGQY